MSGGAPVQPLPLSADDLLREAARHRLAADQRARDAEQAVTQALSLLNQADAAAASLQTIAAELLAQPLSTSTLNRLGEVFHALGRTDSARACFVKAAGVDPANSESANNQGVLYFNAGDYDRAEWFIQRAIELDPQNRAAHENLERLAVARAGERRVPSTEVIVYQMAKVASTAICNAIWREGLEAGQSHYLGEALISERLLQITDPGLDHYFTLHYTGQLVRNIGLTRKLNWYRNNAALHGRKIKIITLTRDPLSWYTAMFTQAFSGYQATIEVWAAESGNVSEQAPMNEKLNAFTTAVATFIERIGGNLEASDYRDRIHWLAGGRGTTQSALAAQALLMARPLTWFQTHFAPTIDIDVFNAPFDTARGYATFSNDFADVLLLRFESLSRLTEVIGDFVGIENFRMERENVSASKDYAADIRAALQDAIPGWLRKELYASRYSRHFGYADSVA